MQSASSRCSLNSQSNYSLSKEQQEMMVTASILRNPPPSPSRQTTLPSSLTSNGHQLVNEHGAGSVQNQRHQASISHHLGPPHHQGGGHLMKNSGHPPQVSFPSISPERGISSLTVPLRSCQTGERSDFHDKVGPLRNEPLPRLRGEGAADKGDWLLNSKVVVSRRYFIHLTVHRRCSNSTTSGY